MVHTRYKEESVEIMNFIQCQAHIFLTPLKYHSVSADVTNVFMAELIGISTALDIAQQQTETIVTIFSDN